MIEIAISLNNVSKCFKRYLHPVERLKELLLPGRAKVEEFWSLRDISLEVPRGHSLGIVGRNGSGKSTLLQIIVGTLTPTTGTVTVKGRISALLELGCGFNPEFTGRQNVFLNGQLIGLTQRDIEDRFDDIAAFADIGDFLDQPVKTYSSGMFVRLAFAVAVSVDPDILVVDEALAVGDAAFQRKCFARIQQIQENGGTILFVSHAASTIVELCNAAVLLDKGELLLSHNPKFVVDKYHKLLYSPADQTQSVRETIRSLNNAVVHDVSHHQSLSWLESYSNGSSNGDTLTLEEFYDPNFLPVHTTTYVSRGAKINNPYITTVSGKKVNHLIGRRHYIYTYSVTFSKTAYQIRFGMLIKTISGLELGGASYSFPDHTLKYAEPGTTVIIKFQFKCILHPGVYFLNAGVSGIVDDHFTYLDRCIDVAMFRVQPDSSSLKSGTVDLLIEPSMIVKEDYFSVEQKQEIELI